MTSQWRNWQSRSSTEHLTRCHLIALEKIGIDSGCWTCVYAHYLFINTYIHTYIHNVWYMCKYIYVWVSPVLITWRLWNVECRESLITDHVRICFSNCARCACDGSALMKEGLVGVWNDNRCHGRNQWGSLIRVMRSFQFASCVQNE